jgi:hypothetical protein
MLSERRGIVTSLLGIIIITGTLDLVRGLTHRSTAIIPTTTLTTTTTTTRLAFASSPLYLQVCRGRRDAIVPLQLDSTVLFGANNDSEYDGEKGSRILKEDENLRDAFVLGGDGDPLPILYTRRVSNTDDDIDWAIWEDLETGRPPELLVMKEVSQRRESIDSMYPSFCFSRGSIDPFFLFSFFHYFFT